MRFKRQKPLFKKLNNAGKSYFLLILSCFLFFNVFSAFVDKSSREYKRARLNKTQLLLKPVVQTRSADSIFSFDESGLPRIDQELINLYDQDSIPVENGKYQVSLTLDKELQDFAIKLLKKYKVPWGSIVALEPGTGKVLTLASHSEKEPYADQVALRETFPAASLFKIVTSAAALEQSSLKPQSLVYYRGGDYSLNKHNYLPQRSRDKREMSFEKALIKSCNPVFARIALQQLSTKTLASYAHTFGFNRELPFDANIGQSSFNMKQTDYSFARTAAGFGDVKMSPLHAASMMATLGNSGKMMRPYVINQVSSADGKLFYQNKEQLLQQAILPDTADTLLQMMTGTVVKGTARKQFRYTKRGALKNIEISAKTGTLSGNQPKGRYHWFVAALPADNPKIALATLVIDTGKTKINGSGLGSLFLEHYAKTKNN